MITEDKKGKLQALKILMEEAWNIANDLVGEEELHSKNEDALYKVRERLATDRLRLDFIKY